MNSNGEQARTGGDISMGKIVRRLLLFTWRYRAGCMKVLLMQVVLLALGVAGLGLTGVGIDCVHHSLVPSVREPRWPFGIAPPADWPPLAAVAAVAAAVIVLALARSVLTYLYSMASVRLVQQQIVVDLRARVYDKMQRLSFRFFDDNASGTVINRITSDVQGVRLFVDGAVIQTGILAISLAVYAVYMVRIDAFLTIVSMAAVPFICVFSIVFARLVRPAYSENRKLMDDLVLNVSETVQGIHVIKGFGREDAKEAEFEKANRRVLEQKNRIFSLTSKYSPSVDMLSHVGIAILLVVGGNMVIHNRLALGTGLVVFLGLLQRFAAQVNTVTAITDNLQQSLAAAQRVFEILDAPLEVQSPPRPVRKQRIEGRVRFENVCFEYDPDEPVLTGISFEAAPGECIGILGSTASGKSTMLSLIPRFYDATNGRLLIDGIDVRRLALEDLRRQVGLVFQESFLFSNTVAANIAFAHPEASRWQIEEAARLAAAHDFIASLPRGYDTVLGEAGADLSGGQRQRLAIARAILSKPAILLLDDPSASVDSETEHEILDSIDSARQGRTAFIVTHRISALSRADKIVVLHRGKIEQVGTHESLLTAGGRYGYTVRIQSEDESPHDESTGQGMP